MASTNINIRIDADLKKSAEELFNDLGLTMSSAITMFLKCAVNNDGIPFAVRRSIPNPVTQAALSEYKDMQEQPDQYKRYTSAESMINEVL